jgi:hypothetical protein
MRTGTSLKVLLLVVLMQVSMLTRAEAPPPQYQQFSPSATKGAVYFPDPVK